MKWLRMPGDRTLAILILLALTGFLVIERMQAGQEDQLPPFSSDSDQPDGLSALASWLAELGYDVIDPFPRPVFAIPSGTDLVFVVEPSTPLLDEDVKTLKLWVEGGGTLIISGLGQPIQALYSQFDLEPRPVVSNRSEDSPPALANPLFIQPPITASVPPGFFDFRFAADDPVFVPLLADEDGAWLAAADQGSGRVIVVSRPTLLTNQSLKDNGPRQLALNLAGLVEPGGRVWFDEWHHGQQVAGPLADRLSGPADWLRFTSPGRSLIFGLTAIFAFLILSGRRLGRAEPLPSAIGRRRAVEYVHAVADMTRRTGRRDELQAHYYQRLKRSLGRRHRLDPAMADEEFARRVGEFSPEIDPAKLLTLLHRLRQTQMTEKELVAAAVELNQLIPQNSL